MSARARRRERRNKIISVAVEMKQDSLDKHGLDPNWFKEADLFEVIKDCTGYQLSEPEWRLAVVAFVEGEAAAKKSVWYK